MITEINREVEQIKILGNTVDLIPITKASIKQIQSLGERAGGLDLADFEEILKIGIGADAFNKVFPDDESMDIEIMVKAALVVYEKFLDKNIDNIQRFSQKYSPNRAARRANKNK